MEWATKINEGRRMWATPGKHLRLSMLQTLARFVNDQFPPEDVLKETLSRRRQVARLGASTERRPWRCL